MVQSTKEEHIKALCFWPFVRGIHRWPVDSPHKGPVIQKAFTCHDVIMNREQTWGCIVRYTVPVSNGMEIKFTESPCKVTMCRAADSPTVLPAVSHWVRTVRWSQCSRIPGMLKCPRTKGHIICLQRSGCAEQISFRHHQRAFTDNSAYYPTQIVSVHCPCSAGWM